MDNSKTIQRLMADKGSFYSFVYTPLEQAIRELETRRGNVALQAYVDKSLTHGLPDPMRGKKSIVLFRHIATPNEETSLFIARVGGGGGRLPAAHPGICR